jgi:DNA repair protein RecO
LSDFIDIQGLVLRKTPYSETSLIFVLLTKESGQLRFILKGARKGSKKKFPAIDLFRHVSIQYSHRLDAELQSVRSCELVTPYDGLATTPPKFRSAAWLCQFMERNTMPEVCCAGQFRAMVTAFERLSAGEPPLAVCTATLIASLDEHGLLPDSATEPQQREAMQYLLNCTADAELPLPAYEATVWRNLFDWAVSFVREGELHVPDTDRLK